jgi:hypothetical protein
MKTRLTLLTLLMAAVGLAGCSEKRDETKVAFALNGVELAAWQAAVELDRADRKSATVADGVNYTHALASLKEAEAAAKEKQATESEIAMRRDKGRREGKKFAAGLRVLD